MRLKNLFVLLVLLCPAMFPQSSQVQKIEIHSWWGGLGAPRNGTVLITRDGDHYVDHGRMVDPEKVQALIGILRQPTTVAITPQLLGIDDLWLRKNLSRAEKSIRGNMLPATPAQRSLFEANFTKMAVISPLVSSLFRNFHTDDYPGVEVTISYEDGQKQIISTHSQWPLMVPWKAAGGESWNPAISRAVSNLLPPNSPNKERLVKENFVELLSEAVINRIEDQWKLLGAQAKAGAVLERLETVYTLSRVDINSYHSEMFGRSWDEKGPHEENLHALLRKQAYPQNFQIQLILEYADGKVIGVDDFFTNASKYEALARSVPWLNQYLAEHPKVTATLYQVHGRSFVPHAMQTFAKDMKQRQREDLIARVAAQQDEIALLDIGSGLWLLFPDHRMILWRYEMKQGLLKWTVKDFPEAECGDYRSNFGGCSGREINADGTLLEDRPPADEACIKAWRATKPEFASSGEALFPVTRHGRTGYIDVQGKIRIPLCYEAAGDFSEGVAAFERDKLWGYMDKSGSAVIAPRFPWAEKFSEGLAFVQASGSQLGYDGKWGYVDHNGAFIVPAIYQGQSSDEDVAAFRDGRALVYTGEAYGYIDRNGKEVIPPRYRYASAFADGLAVVTEDERMEHWGAITRSGEWAVPPTVPWLSSFSEGLAAAGRSSNCGFVDHKGEMILHPEVPAGEKDCAAVYGSFSGGLARWRQGTKFGYIDKTGKWVVEPKYDLTYRFIDGLAAVKLGNQWGYIDPAGRMVIPLHQWSSAGEFHDGAARITTKDGVAYINRAGKYIWGPTPQTD